MRSVDSPGPRPSFQVWEQADDELIRRARTGEAEAFDALYREYHPKVFRYLAFRLPEREAAADLAQDVFVAAWRALPSFEPRHAGSVAAWLFTVARNLLVDHTRRSGRTVAVEQVPEHGSVEFEGDSLSRLRVVELLERIPEHEREVLVLRFIVELPREDVARLMGRTPDAVTQLQYRALERLRTLGGEP